MAYINCAGCWVQTRACCWSWSKCKDCKEAVAKAIRDQLEKDMLERKAKIDSGEIVVTPVNIADLNSAYCRYCGIPKTRCNCEMKGKS
jgi:hypothetical protein